MKWIIFVALTALPLWAQTPDSSRAGIPFSPTNPWGYSTVQYTPTNSNGVRYRNTYGRPRVTRRRGNRRYPGSYNNPFNSGMAQGSGRPWPSAAEESALHPR